MKDSGGAHTYTAETPQLVAIAGAAGAVGDHDTPEAGEPGDAVAAGGPSGDELAGAAKITTHEIGDRRTLIAEPEMSRLYGVIERLARGSLPILLVGETGVGKDHAALAVHAWSGRAAAPLLALHCAALDDDLIEGELFGHERGAFSGAITGKLGLLERAHGGTLILDDVDRLSPTVQARLLRVLDDRRMTRLGGTLERTVDVRIISSTRHDLAAEVAAGRFREDLRFRLSGATLVLPPLRLRTREVPILAHHFLAAARGRTGDEPVAISPAALARLVAHPWPGNLRELDHAMTYAAALVDGEPVEPWHLPEAVAGAPAPQLGADPATPAMAAVDAPAVDSPPQLRAVSPVERTTASFRPVAEELRALERRRMLEALRATGGVQRRAAELIGMPVRTFTFKLTQYGLRLRLTGRA